jgi:hypothetical protein
MLCPFSTDIVPPKIESGECLYWSIMVCMQSIRRQIVLPCCCGVLEPDVVLLQHRYCSPQDWEWWVSILIDNGVYAVEEKTNCLTVLLCSAWARCCAPSAPILFPPRSRVVSVYMKTQIKSNIFKCLKFVVSHSFRNHFLLFTALLDAALDRFVYAILYKENSLSERVCQKGLCASLCCILEIVWDFWSGGVCDEIRSFKVTNGSGKLSKVH